MLKKIYYNLPDLIQNYIDKAASKISNNYEEEFINSDVGKEYDLTKKDKLKILDRIKYGIKKVQGATSLNVHIELGKKILSLNPSNNIIVECGCFKGASSISLSIFSKIVNRKLIIYDSFEGLPDDDDIGKRDYPFLQLTGKYKKGMYNASIDEVTQNLKLYGEFENCELRKGYFEKSLKNHNEKIDFLFLDVDLVKSTQDCIKYLWKHLKNNSYIYTDDACDIDVVKFWFDEKWWKENLNCNPPGYVGSGCGIPIGGKFSSLGFAIKNSDINKFKKAHFLY